MMSFKIKSALNHKYMTAPDGLVDDSLIYCTPGLPLEFEIEPEGTPTSCAIRAAGTHLFLSYRGWSGAVKLFHEETFWELRKSKTFEGAYFIWSLQARQGMWMLTETEPYVEHRANSTSQRANWFLEGIEWPVQSQRVEIPDVNRVS